MKEFLILLYRGDIHTDKMEEIEKHHHLVKWGIYLAKVNQTNFHEKGSPLAKAGKLINSKGTSELSAERPNRLNAYMIFKAKNFEAIETILQECPFFENENARMEVLEMEPGLC